VLFGWKENDPGGFIIADATVGVCVFGATGSGKTSGPGKMLAYAYRLAGRVAALAWKWCFSFPSCAAPASPTLASVRYSSIANEAQNFCTEHDADQAVARSAGGCTVYLSQQRESLRKVLKTMTPWTICLGTCKPSSSARTPA